MTEKLVSSDETSSSWDMSDVPEFNPLPDLNPEPTSKEKVEFWSNEYNSAELQFSHYAKRLNISNLDDHEYNKYCRTVGKYEQDIAFYWQNLEVASNQAMSSQLIRNAYELADTQSLGVVEPAETIEAATGIFYDERMEALSQQILASEQNDETVADRALTQRTWRKVMDYIEASTDYDFLHRDYSAYQNARRTCHNHMIRQLNTLNQLCEKYGTMRFTPRDFMTNDFAYDERADRGSKLNRRANYDRETVMAYFRTVFQRDFETMERKAQYSGRSLQAGMSYYD